MPGHATDPEAGRMITSRPGGLPNRVALTLCVVLLLAGCGPSPSPALPATPTGPAATVTVPIEMPVVVSVAGFVDEQTLSLLAEQIAAFEAANSDVRVELLAVKLDQKQPGFPSHVLPQYLAGVIADQRVSVVHFVPSMLAVFCDVLGDRVGGLSSVGSVFTSGEALAPATAQQLLAQLPAVALVNLYGPTEAAVDVTASSVGVGDESVTIGVPVANTGAFVLDGRLGLVPVGVAAEVELGGCPVS